MYENNTAGVLRALRAEDVEVIDHRVVAAVARYYTARQIDLAPGSKNRVEDSDIWAAYDVLHNYINE